MESCLSGIGVTYKFVKSLQFNSEIVFSLLRYMWYKLVFDTPNSWEQPRTLLHFGAVDWECTVYLNNKVVGNAFSKVLTFAHSRLLAHIVVAMIHSGLTLLITSWILIMNF